MEVAIITIGLMWSPSSCPPFCWVFDNYFECGPRRCTTTLNGDRDEHEAEGRGKRGGCGGGESPPCPNNYLGANYLETRLPLLQLGIPLPSF